MSKLPFAVVNAGLLAGVLAGLPVVAAASTPVRTGPAAESYLDGGALTYEVFEASIDHVDLETCPEMFDPEAVFCRMTLANQAAHVFVFSYQGAQRLLAVKSYALSDGFPKF